MIDLGRVVIVGAGPAGIGAAHRLQELGHSDFVILERDDHAGGLASSFTDGHGFTWDSGGHVQFSHYAYYDRFLDSLPIEWLWHERESWIWIRDRFVPYPFQNNIHRMDAADRDRILFDLERAAVKRSASPPAKNFGEWIELTFGKALGEIFLTPYNFKVWGYPPSDLDTRWMGDRVAVPDLDRIRRNIAEHRDDVSWGPNSTFRFPLVGGTGSIWRSAATRLPKIESGQEVRRVDADSRKIHLSNRRIDYDALISTIPLVELVRIIDSPPPAMTRAAASLVSSSTHVFGVGMRGGRPSALQRKCWMYFPEANSPYYRVTVFSNYSPRNVPDGEDNWSLMAEVSETNVKPVDRQHIFDWVIAAMRADGLIEENAEIVSRWHQFVPYGYPTPTIGRDAALAALHPELEKRRIFSRGRFGAWKYEVSNQDHSFMQGVELVNRLAGIDEEYTMHRPDYANSGVFKDGGR